MSLNITTSDGKYTVIQNDLGGITFLRYGELWETANRDYGHLGLIAALAFDLDDAREQINQLKESQCKC